MSKDRHQDFLYEDNADPVCSMHPHCLLALCYVPDKALFSQKKKKIRQFFFFLHENICYRYTLEVPQ